MTLVQTCIADKGDCVILIADRLLTSQLSEDLPSYEFEATVPKIISKGNVGIGFAGSSLYADLASVKVQGLTDFDEIVDKLSTFIKEEKQKIVDSFIKRLTGVESKDFFNNKELPIPVELRGYVYGKLKDFEIGCHWIIVGFDKEETARIVVIDEQGDITEITTFSVCSIGSGSPFSRIYFDQYGYDRSMDVNQALFFAYEAKEWAQSHTGVGLNTDILIFRKGKKVTEIYNDDELMKTIHKRYMEEGDRHKEARKKLLDGVLK